MSQNPSSVAPSCLMRFGPVLKVSPLLALVLAVLVCVSGSALGWASVSKREFKPAVELYRNGAYSQALTQFKRMANHHPDDPKPVYYQALCHVQLGQFKQAKTLYESVVLLFPHSEPAKFSQQGLALMASTQPEAEHALGLDEPPALATFMSQAQDRPQSGLKSAQRYDTSGEAYGPFANHPSQQQVTVSTGSSPGLSPADVGLAPKTSSRSQAQFSNAPTYPAPQQMAPPMYWQTAASNATAAPVMTAAQQQEAMQQAQMQQMMMMSSMGGGQGGGGSMSWLMPMMMMQNQNGALGNPGAQTGGMPGGMDPQVMSQLMMNSMMGSMDFGLNTKDK